MSKYYTKPKSVKAHTRYDPRVKKRVGVHSYSRNQRYRNYETVSLSMARRSFNQRSERAKAMDLSKTSKKVFNVPNEYWVKYMERSDVKGIDTKIIEYTKKETLVKNLKTNIEKAKKLKDQIIKSKDYKEKEELRERLKQLQEKHNKLVEELREFEGKEIAVRRKELEKKRSGTLQKDIKKLEEIKEKFRKYIKGKYEKEQWDKEKITQFGDYNDLGILDSNKITILTTNQQFEGSMIDKHAKNRKQVEFDLDRTRFILTDNGGLYEFDDKKLCGYDKQYFERAIKSLKNPKVFYQPKKPLIIQGDTFTYAIAPRDYEPDLDPYDAFYDDDDWEIMKKNKNELKTHEIKLRPKQYKKLISFKKSNLVDKYYEIQRDYDILIDPTFKPEKAEKHELLYRLLHKIQEIPEKKARREKFVEDIGNLAIKKIESRYKPEKTRLEDLAKKFTNKEKWEKNITKMESFGGSGIKSKDHIALVVDSDSIKTSEWYNHITSRVGYLKIKPSDKEIKSITQKDIDYIQLPTSDLLYRKDYYEDAIQNFKSPEIHLAANSPIIIEGKEKSMVIAPFISGD